MIKSRCLFSGALLARGIGAIALAMAAASPAAAQCTGFNLTQSSGASIVPGVTDIGNHTDDGTTAVSLPFPVTLYGATYNTVNASSNGNLQFTTASTAFTNACLPQAALGIAICAHWDDMRTDGAGNGIFTSISGSAPNRIFNIEWRTVYFGATSTAANFEVRLYEDNSRVEMIYGPIGQTGTSATVGIQHTTFPATQFECNAGGLAAGTMLTYTCTNGPIPPTGTGAASPASVFVCGSGSTTRLTVTVLGGFNPASTGLAVQANLTSIGGSATQQFYNDGTHGDVTAGDSIFSYSATVNSEVAPGGKSIGFTVSDAQLRSSTGAMGVTINGCPVSGPDVFVARLTDIGYYGVSGNITAYAVGTDACNNGDLPVTWHASVNEHPVIAQNMYRLKNGRFEQIGQSWLKHGFSSTNSGTCGTCTQPPEGGQQLGVGCSDAYGSGLNGSQGNLGPRSQVNATTAAYPYPFTAPPATDATISRRLQVYSSDVDPAQNVGARYFADCHYVTFDDARWTAGTVPAINGLNNATYQEMSFGATNPSPSTPGLISTVHRMSPGIQAWKDVDSAVTLVNADYIDTSLSSPGIRARFIVGARVTDNGNGTWHYEYAVYNHNADRNGGSFSVPVHPGVTVTNIGFHGVFAHSGEPYPNTAANPDNWAGTYANGEVRWNCPEAFSGNGDNANALRWSTMYNFRFDADIGPATGAAVVGLFKPGAQTSVAAINLPVAGCVADFDDGSATGNPDGGVGIEDLLYYLARYDLGC